MSAARALVGEPAPVGLVSGFHPSIRRLLAARLVTAGSPTDRRGTRGLLITPQGLDGLRAWVLGLKPELGTPTPDPIRSRAQFITSVPLDDRADFVEEARRITTDALHLLQQKAEANSGDDSRLLDQIGTLGSILELRARLEWLREIAGLVRDDMPSPEPPRS